MRHQRLTQVIAALAVAVSVGGAPAPTLAAGLPDLQVQLESARPIPQGTLVVIKELNAGQSPADRHRTTVLENGFSKVPIPFDIPVLAPGQSFELRFQTLGACDLESLTVDADDLNIVRESNEANNTLKTGLLCNRPSYTTSPIPPSEQKLSLKPSGTWTHAKLLTRDTAWPTPFTPSVPCYAGTPLSNPDGTIVGYANNVEDCSLSDVVYQTALTFDLRALHAHQQVAVEHAYLNYHERVIDARVGDGSPPPNNTYGSCGNALGLANNMDWLADNYDGLIDNSDAPVGPGSGATHWDVTNTIEQWFIYGGGTAFVIRGDNESFPENDAACISFVGGFSLDITFMGV